MDLPPGTLGGSLTYLPALSRIVSAALLFPACLALRTLDLALCPSWPWGTHFAWQLLNALVLNLLPGGLTHVDTSR